MKGKVWGVEAILLVCAVAVCIVAVIAYLKRDDGASKEFKDTASDLKASFQIATDEIAKLNVSNAELIEELKAIKTVSDGLFADHGKRITEIENRKPMTQLNDINLRFKEPLKVSIIYRQALKKIPEATAHINGKTSLIKRAGLLEQ